MAPQHLITFFLLASLTTTALIDLGITLDPYLLTNSFTGPNLPLTALNTASPLPWPVETSTPGSSRTLALSIRDRGIDPATGNVLASLCDISFTPDLHQQHCLDVTSTAPNETRVTIQINPGDPPTQVWMLHKTGRPDWPFKLSNVVLGPTRFLDTYSDTHQAFLSEGDYSGQYWAIELAAPLSVPRPLPPAPPVVTVPKVICNPPTFFQFCEHNCPPVPPDPCKLGRGGG